MEHQIKKNKTFSLCLIYTYSMKNQKTYTYSMKNQKTYRQTNKKKTLHK